MAAPASKSVFSWGGLSKPKHDCWFKRHGVKMSSKGINQNKLVKACQEDDKVLRQLHLDIILQKDKKHMDFTATNKGFRVIKTEQHQRMSTYRQRKVCLSYWFDKAKVQPDMVTLKPLDL